MSFTPQPRNWIQPQPRIRTRQDDYRIVIQLAWSDGHAPEVVPSVTVTTDEGDELVSLVVGLTIDGGEVPSVVAQIGRDAADFIRRTRDPFDDLL